MYSAAQIARYQRCAVAIRTTNPELIHLCDPTTENAILVVSLFDDLGVPVTTAYELNGTPYTGAIADLVQCDTPEDVRESDTVVYCLDGTTQVNQHVIKLNGEPNGDVFWTNLLGDIIPAPTGTLVLGTCKIVPQPIDTGLFHVIDPVFIDSKGNEICAVPLYAILDEGGNVTETFYFNPSNGVKTMGTGNTVGSNTTAPLQQGIANYTLDLDQGTYTAANLIAYAIASGTNMIFDDGSTRAVVATDFITRIDADLKPVNGHGNIAGVTVTSTTADAQFTSGSSTTDIDAGGSRELGSSKSAAGFFIRSNFDDIVVAAGSVVTVAFDLSHIPT